VKKLQKFGFEVIRQRGSHVVLRHADGRVTVVPCHKGQDLDGSLIRKIIKDAKLTPEAFNNC
jgi:predicted RNA binding protein YcfA (HicA-like mRNA interferase family)